MVILYTKNLNDLRYEQITQQTHTHHLRSEQMVITFIRTCVQTLEHK